MGGLALTTSQRSCSLTSLKSKFVQLTLAVILAVPAGIGGNAIQAHAAWSYKSFTDTVVSLDAPYFGTVITSVVQYTVGYNSSGYPIEVHVTKFVDTIGWQKCTL